MGCNYVSYYCRNEELLQHLKAKTSAVSGLTMTVPWITYRLGPLIFSYYMLILLQKLAYPGLHQKKRGQHVKGGDSTPESSAQERHGPVGEGPEEGHKNDQRVRTPHLWGKAERVGAVQPGEEKAPGRLSSSLPVPEGGLQESWRGTFYKGM